MIDELLAVGVAPQSQAVTIPPLRYAEPQRWIARLPDLKSAKPKHWPYGSLPDKA